MKLIPALIAAAILTSGAGVYAYAQNQTRTAAPGQQAQRSPGALDGHVFDDALTDPDSLRRVV